MAIMIHVLACLIVIGCATNTSNDSLLMTKNDVVMNKNCSEILKRTGAKSYIISNYTHMYAEIIDSIEECLAKPYAHVDMNFFDIKKENAHVYFCVVVVNLMHVGAQIDREVHIRKDKVKEILHQLYGESIHTDEIADDLIDDVNKWLKDKQFKKVVGMIVCARNAS